MGKTIFSLLKAIQTKVNGETQDVNNQKYFETGREEFRNAGLKPAGDFQIPMKACMCKIDEAGVWCRDRLNIWELLFEKNKFIQAGAKVCSGLVGDVIPVIEIKRGNVLNYSEEIIKLSPKRLTAYVDISRHFLFIESDKMQMLDVEQIIRTEIVDAINRKLESTIKRKLKRTNKEKMSDDYSNLVIGQWGAIDVAVDNYSQATRGCVRLVINTYFDAKIMSSDVFVFGSVN